MPDELARSTSAYLFSEVGVEDEAGRLRKQAAMVLALKLPGILDSIPKGGSFFDLGCGIGLLADAVARARPDVRVCGFDADKLAVEKSTLHFGSRHSVTFGLRRIEEGPPPGLPPADTAVMRLVLMHLPEPKKALRAAASWLKPGGVLHVIEGDDRALAMEPTLPCLNEVLDLMERVQVRKGGSRRLGRDLSALMNSAGWNIAGECRHAPEPRLAAEAFPAVFLPVAEYYLDQAVQLTLADSAAVLELKRALRNSGGRAIERATIPIYHTWASFSFLGPE